MIGDSNRLAGPIPATNHKFKPTRNKACLFILALIFGLTLSFTTTAQTQQITWAKSYGSGDYDYAYCIHQTQDGGYIVAGQWYSPSVDPAYTRADFWVLKLDL